MKYREMFIRIVDSDTGVDRIEYRPFLLLRAAHAAAEETVLGAPLCSAWLQLFQSHLSTSTRKLRWRGDLAESAEMRRAYSAMYGRYFSRGILESRLGITDFVPLNRTNTIIKNGVTIHRSRNGDIPDWIAWNWTKGSYVLAEAKGNLTGKQNDFLCQKPSCIESGEAQIDRVDVYNLYCEPIGTHNWVAANLWSTEVRGKHPVSLLWHSIKQGKELENHEIPVHAAAIRKHRILQIASRLLRDQSLRSGQEIPYLNLRISIEPSDVIRTMEPEDLSILEEPSTEPIFNLC